MVLVLRGILICVVVVGARAAPAVADAGTGVTCVDAGTGAERWRTPTAAGRIRLRGDGDTVWEGRPGEAWRRRDLLTGQVLAAGAPGDAPADTDDLWTTTDAILETRDGVADAIVTTGAFVDDLAVVGDVLAFALDKDDGAIRGWDRAAGALAWTLRPREVVPGAEIGDGSRVEVLGERLLVYAPPAIMAVDPATGVPAWITPVTALAGHWGGLRAAAVADTWIAAIDGVVVALDADTGTTRWTIDAGAGAATALVIGDDTACFDRRAAEALPFAPDEAEVARSVAITVAHGAITAMRWVSAADVPAGARRRSAIELPLATTGATLTLAIGDTSTRRDVTSLRAEDGTVYLDVAGAWEDARVGRITAAAP